MKTAEYSRMKERPNLMPVSWLFLRIGIRNDRRRRLRSDIIEPDIAVQPVFGFREFEERSTHLQEPVTLVAWLREFVLPRSDDKRLLVLHPDPPLGRDEIQVLMDLTSLYGLDGRIDILTPRGLAIHGG